MSNLCMFQHAFAHISAHIFKTCCIMLHFSALIESPWSCNLTTVLQSQGHGGPCKSATFNPKTKCSFLEYLPTRQMRKDCWILIYLATHLNDPANGWIQQGLTVPFHHAHIERYQAQQWIPWTCKDWRWDAKKQTPDRPGMFQETMA